MPRPHPLRHGISPTLTALVERAKYDGTAVDTFLATTRLPLVEATGDPGERLVSFCWHDPDATQVLLFANRLTDETRLDETLLRRLPGTDLWSLSVVMESDWRASYCFLVQQRGESAPWIAEGDQVRIRTALDHGQRDPANPHTCRNRAGIVQSVVSLPDAPPQPHLVRRAAAPAGVLRSAELFGGRAGWTWEASEGLDPEAPLLVALDGEVWTGPHDLTATLDNLVAASLLPRCRALFVSAGSREQRWSELGGDASSYLTDEVLDFAGARGWLPSDPRRVVVAGQSLGGLTALRLGLRHPDLVGTVLSQSASLWLDDLSDDLAELGTTRPRIHLAHGRQEWVLAGRHADLAARLTAAGVEVEPVEVNGGHDYAWWRGTLADALVWAFAPR